MKTKAELFNYVSGCSNWKKGLKRHLVCFASKMSNLKRFCLCITIVKQNCLTLSWRRPISYRNQSIDLLCKSMDWFPYDNGPRHERVNALFFYYSACSLKWIHKKCNGKILSDDLLWRTGLENDNGELFLWNGLPTP